MKTRAKVVASAGITALTLTTLSFNPAFAEPAASAAISIDDPTIFVNPFIGTLHDGNTYPGATVPFGGVQYSPDTGHVTGYDYNHDRIRGFSPVHISGVGCGLGGQVEILPYTGTLTTTNSHWYQLPFNHDGEAAEPGYYTVDLQAAAGLIDVQLTATEHTGIAKYTFPATSDAKVIINAGQALQQVTESSVTIIDDRTVETTTTSRGFCQGTRDTLTVHTRTEFSRPFTAQATFTGETQSAGSSAAASTERTGAILTFDAASDQVVEAQTSLSWVDSEGARLNLEAERSTFDAARLAAHEVWKEQLKTIEVTSSDLTQLRTFYSALYRSFLAPNTGTDVDGRYYGRDHQVHEVEPGRTYYQNFSLWDTYRTHQQFLYLTEPERSKDMAYSLLLQARQGGWAPRWSFGTIETNTMTGDPITPFMVMAWKQGLLAGYEQEVYDILLRNVDNAPTFEETTVSGRVGTSHYIEHGYVPLIDDASMEYGDNDFRHGASATLEYALADAALSTMAEVYGTPADAARLAQRAQNYRALYDRETNAFRARFVDGSFDPGTHPASAPGFHEGTAVQYEWLVPQDVQGLFELMGGLEATSERLDEFFAYDELLLDPEYVAREVWVTGTYDYYNQDTYNPNNEPDLHAPYMYMWTGEPYKTTDVLRAALTLFTDGPDGVTGNDDLGQMSSWAVLASLGLYPVIPGESLWAVATPSFEAATIHLDEDFFGKSELVITAPGVSQQNRYTQSLTVNGAAHHRAWLSGPEFLAATNITHTVGANPSTWATDPSSAPAPVVTDDGSVERMTASANGPFIVPAGTSGTVIVDAVVQGNGEVTGVVEVVDVAPELTLQPEATWSANPNGATTTAKPQLHVAVPAGTPAGNYPATLRTTSSGGAVVDSTVEVIVPSVAWLASSYNNVGIGDSGVDYADFDGGGFFFLRDRLAQAGLAPGKVVTVPGTDLQFALPDVPVGEPDNFTATGQTIQVGALSDAEQISVIGAGTNGLQAAQVRLNFTDGSNAQHTVQLPDWCSNSFGTAIPLPKPSARGERGHADQQIGCGVAASAVITVPDGKHLQSLTFGSNARFHVFAVASDAPLTAPTPSTAAYTGQAIVGNTVTAVAPSWNLPGTTTSYQWTLDGQIISGETGPTYTVRADDIDKQLSVTITGTPASGGYVPGVAVAPAQVVTDNVGVVLVTPVGTSRTVAVGDSLVGFGAIISRDGQALRGEPVTFAIAGGATLSNGSQSVTVSTNAAGIAVLPRITTTAAGDVNITATYAGLTQPVSVVRVEAPAPSQAQLTVTPENVANKWRLHVTVTNGDAAADIRVTTRYGSKTFPNVAANAEVTYSFNTFTTKLPASTVTATITSGGQVTTLTEGYTAQ